MINYIINFFRKKKKIDLKKLPSQGFFYNNDFELYIKKADIKDILEYENDFDSRNLGLILFKIKNVVKNNTIIKNSYDWESIKSIDVIFIFFEIVKLTKNKSISFLFNNRNIEFSDKTFNYFDFSKILNKWNKDEKCFNLNGYKYSLPSIGVESSLTTFLIDKSYGDHSEKYSKYSYSFVYFLNNKLHLSYDEIENLIQIFNYDIDIDEIVKIDEIVNIFANLQRYTIRYENNIIELNSKINLQFIWK